MASDLRLSFADYDRSCPPGTSGSWCRADPARTSVGLWYFGHGCQDLLDEGALGLGVAGAVIT